MPIPLIAAGIGAIGSVAGAGIASHAQSKSQNAQLTAVNQAQGAVAGAYNTGRQALGQTYQTQQQNLSPYQALGAQALGSLGSRIGIPPPGTVAVRNKMNGMVYHLPQATAQAALQAGGELVQS